MSKNTWIQLSKNQPTDFKFSCKSPSSLAKFIQRDGNLEELKKSEGAFEWDECCWTMKL